jgi:hypothetical protein
MIESMQIQLEWLETNRHELSEGVADYANLISSSRSATTS